MRLAKELGDLSLLFPAGITHILDLPYNLFNAIRYALSFIGFDELPRDERPPRSIWMEPDLMTEHMKGVEAARNKKYGLKSDKISDEPIDGPSERNALADELLV